jgi:hypothetical protein
MKNFSFKSIFYGFLVVLTNIGCSSDSVSSSSCPIINCQNGGTFVNCQCDCPDGYSGEDCGTQITPSKIKITKFKITSFSNTNVGSSWDTNSEPDIFLQMIDEHVGTYIWISDIYPNVLSTGNDNFIFIPNAPIEIINTSSFYSINLVDNDVNDTPSYFDEQMSSVLFNIYTPTNHFPSTLYLTDNQTYPFKVELSLTYEW